MRKSLMISNSFIINIHMTTKLVVYCALILAFKAGDLTNNNCNTGVTAASINVTSGTSLQPIVDLFYSNLYSSDQKAQIQAYIINGNTTGMLAVATSTQFLIPFIVLAAVFALTYIMIICCCLFQKSCPPCESWKRDFVRRPYEKFQLRCVMIFLIIFSVGILVTSIISFASFPSMQSDISNTKCALYTSLDVGINGDQTNKWGGFQQLQNQIGNISTLLNTASSQINSNLAGNDWLLNGMQTLKTMNLNIYKNNANSTVTSPWTANVTAAVSVSAALPTRVPLFISSGLGPNGTANTMTSDIDLGLRTTEQLSSQGYGVYSAAFLMASSAATITANTNQTLNQLAQNSQNLLSIQASLDSFSNAVFDQIFSWILYLIEGMIGFILVGSLLCILGSIATHSFDIFACRTTVHIGWVIYGLTYFGIIVLTFLFFALGGLSYTFCDFYGSMINSQSSFSTFGQQNGNTSFNKAFQKLDVCFYGDGNILKKFNIASEMATVTNLFSNIQTFYNMQDSTTTVYVDKTISTSKIQGWMYAMGNYSQGIYVDWDPAETSENNPNVSLSQLNVYSNGLTNSIPTCTLDYWVFDKINCTHNSTQSIYVSDASGTSGSIFTSPGNLCISFNEKYQSTLNYPWSQGDISNRYRNRRQCGSTNSTQAHSEITSRANALIYYRDSRINLYTGIADQLNNLLIVNQQFNSNISTFTSNLNTFFSSVSALNNLVTNQINGLTISSNCTTIANNLRVVHVTFCQNFIYKAVKLGICCIVLLAIMVGGLFTGSVFSVRYSRVEKEKRIVAPQQTQIQINQELHSETFQKRNNSSSSSSDED